MRSLFKAADPLDFDLGIIPLTILVKIPDGVLGWNGPCFGWTTLAIFSLSKKDSITLDLDPEKRALSEFTITTEFPVSSNFATLEQSRPAI
jgi:hypothetical protein